MSQKNKTAAASSPAQRRFDALVLAARLAAGGLLLFAGILKISAPTEEFGVVIEMYDILPAGMSLTAAAFLPWIEIILGWALLLGWQTRAAASAAAGMFAVFIFSILQAKFRGIPMTNCGCFGGAFHPNPMATLAVDVVVAALLVLAARRGPSLPSLDTWAEGAHN